MTFSALSAYAEEFLALRRAVAKPDPHHSDQDRRSLRHREKLLRGFIAFWHDQGCLWPIRAALVLDWIALGADRQHPYRDQERFYTVRAFLRQVRIFEPSTEIPENIFRPMRRRRAPHLYSDRDIVRLMDAAWQLRLFDNFRPLTIHTLIGLLASTGLRIGEALALKVEDVKLSSGPPHLLIYESKFGKSRNVVLHPSTAEQLRKYLIARSKALRGYQVQAFFTNRRGKYLRYHSQRMMFLRLLKRAGICGAPGQRGPSLHSFRHTFAVKRLTLWYRQRRNVQELLPHLAVYLGHLGPENTYWYLSNTPELLQAAGELFEFQPAEGGSSR
jgi:integrase/recombinase XerD